MSQVASMSSNGAIPSSYSSSTSHAGRTTPTPGKNLCAALATLGVAATGALFFPPLRLGCLPGFLYLGANATQNAYTSWQEEKRLTVAAVEGVGVALCLLQGWFVAGAFGLSLYYLGQMAAGDKRKPNPPQAAWQPPRWAWRREREKIVETPINLLQTGDMVVVHAGEMIPLGGVVAEGEALLRTPHQGQLAENYADRQDTKVSTGHWVDATSIVMVGSICVIVTGTSVA